LRSYRDTGGGLDLPPLRLDLRYGDVGGDRWWSAVTPARRLETEEPDGEIRKMMMKMHSTAPRMRVEGLAFFRRTDPMARAMTGTRM
jgi:hypothetical protein